MNLDLIPKLKHTKWGLKKEKPFDVLGVKMDGKEAPHDVSKLPCHRIPFGFLNVLLDTKAFRFILIV